MNASTSHKSPARWIVPELHDQDISAFARRAGLQMPAARVLWSRGIREAQDADRFLNPRLSDLNDPFLLLGMQRAAERIRRAVRQGERILLYGDYDTDGVLSVVILSKMIERLGGTAAFHVPDRMKDGYGMQPQVIEEAAREGVRLVVSVDTGIRAGEAVAAGNQLGVDTIITDHHLPEAELPPAYAIVNPNQPGCAYPNKNLCGAGVAFKLVQALMHQEEWSPDRIVRFSDSFLIMAAIATVADVVPLTGENRVVVRRGLDGLRNTHNPGLRALLESAGLKPGDPLTASDIAFRVSPRINAAGRMRNARDVIQLFLTADDAEAREIAAGLAELNFERRQTGDTIVREITEECVREPVTDERAGLVFSSPGWHKGVVGIVASRVVEEYHRPVLVLAEDHETGLAQGSGRSIAAFHLLEALESMADLFVRFGGHRQAVGVTLETARIAELRERFNAYVRERLKPADMAAERRLDAVLRVGEINDASIAEVLRLAPFGLANPAPQFLIAGAELAEPPAVFKERHVRLKLRQNGAALTAKAWNAASSMAGLPAGTRLDLAVTFEDDLYSASRGYAPWSATVREFRPAVEG